MYTRQLCQIPPALIKNGRPVFGTFDGHVSKLDIRGLRGPFGGVPLPYFITNFRIKSSLTFNFSFDGFVISVLFFDAKLFGLAEIDIWNEKSGRKYAYKSIMGPRRRFIPHNLEQGFCANFKKSRYVRISWDHKRDRFSIIFNVQGDSVRPSVQAAFNGHFSSSSTKEITQCVPIKSRRRCSASYISALKVHGSMTFGATKNSESRTWTTSEGSGIFLINRAYYGYVSQMQFVHASGMQNGRQISFVLENLSSLTFDPEISNRNGLIVDGEWTPLPPVKMTQPFGILKKWIIQDTENMVDLTFEPLSNNYRELMMMITKIRINIIYGKFEGVLKTKDGEALKISGFGGIARDHLLRT